MKDINALNVLLDDLSSLKEKVLSIYQVVCQVHVAENNLVNLVMVQNLKTYQF